MYHIVLLLITLVPSPRVTPKPVEVHPIIGSWSIDWGPLTKQTTFFFADGTCFSPEFNGGTWVDVGGTIWFTEQNGTNQYFMQFDWFTGDGDVWYVNSLDGIARHSATLKLRRGEYLHRIPPRVVE